MTANVGLEYIVDQYFRNRKPQGYFGWVVFARTQPAEWITPLFQMPE